MTFKRGYMKKLSFIPLIVLLSLISNQKVFGYDDQIAHPKITEVAVQKSIMKTYLPQSLGPEFLKGYDSPINGTSAIDWIRKGSIAEDAEACRRANHMHNPLKTWNVSYMSDAPWWANACTAWGKKYSNITWATSYFAPPPDGQKVSFTSRHDYAPKNWDVANNAEAII